MKHLSSVFFLLVLSSCAFIFSSCSTPSKEKISSNILWVYLEDTSPLLGAFGTDIITTPNIDKLAVKGMRFTKGITLKGKLI